MAEDYVAWRGELLWPCDLPEAAVIDFSGVEALGVWAYPWFRSRPRTTVVGACGRVRRQMQDAQLPVLWYKSHADRSAASGVTTSERAGLWGED